MLEIFEQRHQPGAFHAGKYWVEYIPQLEVFTSLQNFAKQKRSSRFSTRLWVGRRVLLTFGCCVFSFLRCECDVDVQRGQQPVAYSLSYLSLLQPSKPTSQSCSFWKKTAAFALIWIDALPQSVFLSILLLSFFFFLSFVELGKGIINERKTISENVSFLDYSVRFSSSFSPSLVCRFTSSTRDAETFSNLQHSKATGSTRHSRSRRRTRSRRHSRSRRRTRSRRHSRSRRQTRSRRCTGRRVSVGESQSRFPLVGLLAHAGPTFLTKINGRLLRQEQGVCRRQF